MVEEEDKVLCPYQELLEVINLGSQEESKEGMDVIGPIDPKALNGHRFILMAIDYITKWIEAASYCNVTRGVMLKFIKKELICRYGLPMGIITDNAKNLNNKMMDELFEQFKINH
ncbi:hypothetical protein E6C27_scaffold222G00880 [Cucumis melo var. makuwa]|uniref:Integrase catalytic domain-containing protein n=1 Tax=Cucumis melo var. makuwa TaxID=1194695 RepID=A0A5A7UKB3_CUCMM|nr:hypothetical protein E6C27_scaffold222G00880 [Cucumis melo var. makuwa]